MIDEAAVGRAASTAAHCFTKSGGVASPAPASTAGPQPPRNARSCASWPASRVGGASGTQRLIWKGPVVPVRNASAQDEMAGGAVRTAP